MADIVNIQLNSSVFTFRVRVTTFHMLLGGAIAAAVLYLVNEMIKIEKGQPKAEVTTAAAPTPITRGA